MNRSYNALPTTSGQPLTIGARLRYRRSYATTTQLQYEWRDHAGTVASIERTDGGVRVTLNTDTGQQHHARLIRLGDGSLQMEAHNYVAEILAPAPTAQRETA